MIKRRKLKGGARAWTKRIDKEFHLWIRLRDTNAEGYGECCSCKKPIHFDESNAGHLFSRIYKNTRWNPENVNLQCIYCNQWLEGNAYLYAKNIGFKKADKLEKLSKIKVTFTDEEYADIYYMYKQLILDEEKSKSFR